MSQRPLVSICIPTYNRVSTIEAAICSALTQTYDNVSVLVIDNHSTDGTIRVLERYREACPDRFRFVVNSENVGMVANFRRCVEMADGAYLKILCSDDVAYPTLVEKQVHILESYPLVVAVAARRRRMTDNLLFRLYDPMLKMRPGLWQGGEAVRYVFRVANLIGGPVQLLTRTSALRSVPFRSDPVVGNMFDIMPLLDLLAHGHDLFILDEILCDYNSRASSYTTAKLLEPGVQDYYFALREEQAKDPLFARHLRLPLDLDASRRNATILLFLAAVTATLPNGDPKRTKLFFDYLQERSGVSLLRILRPPVELIHRVCKLLRPVPEGDM